MASGSKDSGRTKPHTRSAGSVYDIDIAFQENKIYYPTSYIGWGYRNIEVPHITKEAVSLSYDYPAIYKGSPLLYKEYPGTHNARLYLIHKVINIMSVSQDEVPIPLVLVVGSQNYTV